tara:strand:- start:7679 stop:8461 length:783 start_codon:yes stop_codon:yes gene_type:complete
MTPEDFEKIQQLIENSNHLGFVYQFVIILIAILLWVITYFGGSYLKKKGENHATKEDVKHITHQIESIKTENQKELEEFKFQIIQKIDKEKEHFDEGMSQLLLYFDSCSDFYFNYLTNQLLWLPSLDPDSYNHTKESFRLEIIAVLKRYQRASIYFELHSELMINARSLVIAAISTNEKLFVHYPQLVTDYMVWYHENAGMTEHGNEVDINKIYDTISVFWDDLNPIVESFSEGYQRLKENMNEYLRSHISQQATYESST